MGWQKEQEENAEGLYGTRIIVFCGGCLTRWRNIAEMMDGIDECFYETLGRPIVMDTEMLELHLFFLSLFFCFFLAGKFCSAGEAIVDRQTQRPDAHTPQWCIGERWAGRDGS